MLKRIKAFFVGTFQQLCRFFGKLYLVEFVEDPIDNPMEKILYVIGSIEEPWQVELLCPCGCTDKIVLPVNDATSPRWNIQMMAGVPSLSPSIWRTKGCKSHFFLKQGKIEWCG